ncbi:MAG TPA: cyclopropane-fatty-acyl-phospholipid synthase family protein [Vicinamibacterales bacterium]|nr:cyclopropane-fatty-acyl-phospholipid synthase family protein [Vicinamibacterales bacterium]
MRPGLVIPFRRESAPATPAEVRPLDRWLGRHLQGTLAPVHVGLRLWDDGPAGECREPIGELVVGDRRTLVGLIVHPELYFGETYTSGRLHVRGELGRVVEALSRIRTPSTPSLIERLGLWLTPANSERAARRNIHHHYDLSNDFYQRWLDPDLVYTCACYPHPGATLEEAQAQKLDLVCRKLGLRPGETVVEAGCGWGALALYMARHYGARVKAFNISTEQLAFARERAVRERLTDRVEFIEDDYRSITGRFDVFVSVGMLEHVGRRRLDAMARVLRRTIDPHRGRGLLHFIGRDHPRLLNAWIRRRIFPGGYAPSLAEVIARVLEPADLSVLDVENLRLHYARTLSDWRARFSAAEPEVARHFGEAFCRAWRLYLAGSEASFTTGWLQLFQVVFAPAGGTAIHWLRPSHAGPARSARAAV